MWRLAELLLGTLKDPDRAVKLLGEARRRFPGAPEIVYYLAIAQREAKQSQQAVAPLRRRCTKRNSKKTLTS